jgi:AbrB family looped-hinge helix DNA binding protein
MGLIIWVYTGGIKSMGTILEVDDRGRITIPKEFRDRFQIRPGDEFRMEEDGGVLLLRRERRPTQKARRGRRWGSEAFLDAGETTFGG